MRTQVAIIGAGPAGLVLAHLLHRAGIDCINLEARTRADVETTLRAGVLEHWLTELLRDIGLGARLAAQAHIHAGITLQWQRQRHHLDIEELTGGKTVCVYPQHELLIDLVAARLADGGLVLFEATATAIDAEAATIAYTHANAAHTIEADWVVAADGFHGPGRRAIPAARRTEYEKKYSFAWLGILARAPLSWPELIYANQQDGFALLSTRSPDIQRMYVQCDPADALWSDARIWDALHARLGTDDGWTLQEGEIIQKNIVPLRSFVCETMRHHRLFLAGDAAHIVPPTGAKGLNLAAADVVVLARGLEAHYRRNEPELLDRYAETCLRRVWKAERFSWYMTTMLHQDPAESAFDRRIHFADLDLVRTNRATAAALAENYVGLPFD